MPVTILNENHNENDVSGQMVIYVFLDYFYDI